MDGTDVNGEANHAGDRSPVDNATAIAGIRAKVRRAMEAVQYLHVRITEFQHATPYLIKQHTHDGGRTHSFTFHMAEPVPVEWSVILGEIVHNLRSALDQTVYQIVVSDRDGGQPLKPQRVSFPICHERKEWKKALEPNGALCEVSPEARAFIEPLQPNRGGGGTWEPTDEQWALSTLHTFWNEDKHQFTKPWKWMLDPQAVAVKPTPQLAPLVNVPNLPDGEEFLRIEYIQPVEPDTVTVQVAGLFFLGFEQGSGPRRPRPARDAARPMYRHAFPGFVAGVAAIALALLDYVTDPHRPEPPVIDVDKTQANFWESRLDRAPSPRSAPQSNVEPAGPDAPSSGS